MPQMTVDSTRIFGCPMCGFRVNEGDSACPRCGNQFSSETKFECPFCGELVDQGSAECPSCHVNYSEFKESSQVRGGDEKIDALLLEVIQLEAQSAKAQAKKFSCPGCSWMLDVGAESCPRCGRDLTVDEEALQCPICGSAVSADSVSCPECGSSFELEKPPRVVEHARMEDTEVASEPSWAPEKAADAESEPEAPAVERPRPEEREPEPVEEDVEKARPSPEPAEASPEIMEEEPRSMAEPPEEERKAALPIRVLAKPIVKPKPAKTRKPEAERVEPKPEEASRPAEDRTAGPSTKSKQRKLKTRKLKPA